MTPVKITGHLAEGVTPDVASQWKLSSLSDTMLRLIWHEKQISRIEIARRLGLARSTVTEIVKGLLNSGFIIEVGTGESSGGRRPISLEFKPESHFILGVDIGATHISVVLMDLCGNVVFYQEQSHPVRTDPNGSLKVVFDLCDAALVSRQQSLANLIGIGVALASPIDPMHPMWVSEVVLPAWHGKHEVELLAKKYKVPVFVDNDANVGAVAEHKWGAGRGINDLIFIKSSHGVGAGYILRGEIYRGASGAAGEIGHFPIDLYGKRCVCGLRGCLVNYVGAEAMKSRARQLFPEYPESPLVQLAPRIRDIENAALNGDALAIRLVRESAEYLGIAIAGWLNLMNPQMIILGGDLSRTGELLIEPLRDKSAHCTLVKSVEKVDIRVSELGSKAVAIGAATVAAQEIFSEPDPLRQYSHAAAL